MTREGNVGPRCGCSINSERPRVRRQFHVGLVWAIIPPIRRSARQHRRSASAGRTADLSPDEAYMLASIAVDFAITQLVDCKRYREAERLLILADSGGSNGCRPRLWKRRLDHRRRGDTPG